MSDFDESPRAVPAGGGVILCLMLAVAGDAAALAVWLSGAGLGAAVAVWLLAPPAGLILVLGLHAARHPAPPAHRGVLRDV